MKKINLSLVFFIAILVSSFSVCASDNAPPAIPSEYWGSVTMNGMLAANGLIVEALVNGINYAQAFQTLNGYYNVILVGGDRELTYEDDSTCAVHWGAGQACVPCDPGTPGDCVEGPQDGEIVKIKVSATGTMPSVDWVKGLAEDVDIVTPIGDWTKDGCVDMGDFVGPFTDNYLAACAMVHPLPACLIFDLNLDGIVDMGDFVGPFTDHYGEGCT